MSTRCRIGICNDDGTIQSIYHHYDGYPEHMVPLLTTYYKDEDIVREMIALGSCSHLEEKLNPTTNRHSFDAPEVNVSVFYHRDRGEDWEYCKPVISGDEDDFVKLASDSCASYCYLFIQGKWYWYCPYHF